MIGNIIARPRARPKPEAVNDDLTPVEGVC